MLRPAFALAALAPLLLWGCGDAADPACDADVTHQKNTSTHEEILLYSNTHKH